MKGKENKVSVRRTSSEQRKLRSRDAARSRRSQETAVFSELAHTLPIPRRVSTHLDKSSIMRVTLSVLRMHHLLRPAGENQREESEEEEEDPVASFYPQALAGFIMVVTEEGDMIYVTENTSRHIGFTQLELLGQNIYDFVHPCDQEELRDLLTLHPGLSSKPLAHQQSERNFFLRMKSTLTSRGHTVNIKSAAWKVLHCTGHIRQLAVGSTWTTAGGVMTLLCEPVPHPSSVEFPLGNHTFLSRHSMDLCFTHCEGRVTELVGYKPEDLIGRSAYEFHHPLDSDHVNKSLHTLLSKGQVNTRHYRFLVNTGGFVWAETQATVLYSSKTAQPEAIVCLNFILSAVEQQDSVFSVEQSCCDQLPEVEPHSLARAVEDCGTPGINESDPGSERLENAGSNPSNDSISKLKEEPEELLQLDPDAGDTVVPRTDYFTLMFASPPNPNTTPDHPQDLCSPQLRQLLSPIFSPITPPSSSSPDLEQSPCKDEENEEEEEEEQEEYNKEEDRDEKMDTSMLGKFFPLWSEDGPMEESPEMDLDTLAPYISMDDDLQLIIFCSLPEEVNKSLSSSSEASAVTPAVPVNRKRTRHPDEEILSLLMIQEKRRKQEPSSTE